MGRTDPPSRFALWRATFAWIAPDRPDVDEAPVTPEVEAELRRRLETFEEDAKVARPWEDVLADLKARRLLPPSPRWRGPFASAL